MRTEPETSLDWTYEPTERFVGLVHFGRTFGDTLCGPLTAPEGFVFVTLMAVVPSLPDDESEPEGSFAAQRLIPESSVASMMESLRPLIEEAETKLKAAGMDVNGFWSVYSDPELWRT